MSEERRNDHEHSNEFLKSISSLSADDISPARKKKRRLTAGLIFHALRRAILLICSVTFVISLIYIFDSLQDYAVADDLYNDLIAEDGASVDLMFASPSLPATPDYDASQNLSEEDIKDLVGTPEINKEFERMKIKLTDLKAKYPDLYGWIVLPGTVINYPIMQAADNDYYLDHSYRGTLLKAGAIFADYRCKKEIMENRNLVIYGHHMTNTSMFNSLDNYLKESFFRETNTVYVYTLNGMYTYEVFSVYETNKYYPYIRTNFTDDETFLTFAETMRENSIYLREDIVFEETSQILTLSTCTNRSEDGRLAVHAVLVDIYIKK